MTAPNLLTFTAATERGYTFVTDRAGIGYGLGDTVDEAMRDWFVAAAHDAYDTSPAHPRVERDRAAVRRLFGMVAPENPGNLV